MAGLPPNPFNITGGPAGPSWVDSQTGFNFSTGAFGSEPARNQLIKQIVPVGAMIIVGLLLWRKLS
ncbi:hypothetical protein [Pseudemcibacter aquimaris]|uniref:hypothetical protein n=1 Tax=Pseudemcibacter aquimaris TaxID=2857064 RepID=UPI002012F1ED|nr:hypothetical protein [Pseudemcibacter aquimaris]MCC3859771.1 hypothetical protein [Pseudemcibacter aquimaris]WDU60165.1 hypothetical protein KW060_07830 [Pseudemcibacter aquimaris]